MYPTREKLWTLQKKKKSKSPTIARYKSAAAERHFFYITSNRRFTSTYLTLGSTINDNGKVVNSKAGVTYNKVDCNSSRKLKSIILPINPNLHILSVEVVAVEKNIIKFGDIQEDIIVNKRLIISVDNVYWECLS